MRGERWFLVVEEYTGRARARGRWWDKKAAEAGMQWEPEDCKPRVIQAATAAEAAEIYERWQGRATA